MKTTKTYIIAALLLLIVNAAVVSLAGIAQKCYAVQWLTDYPKFYVEGSGTISPAAGPYYLGQSLQIRAQAASGWYFSYFKRNGVVQDPSYNPHTFSNLQNGENFTAVFAEGTVYFSLAISVATSNGTTNPIGTIYVEDGTVKYVTAFPDEGFILSAWVWNGQHVGARNPYPAIVTQNSTLVAFFEEYVPEDIEAPSAYIMVGLMLILGLGAVGFAMGGGKDPTPALFLMIVGCALNYWIGWFPFWIFLLGIISLALLSAWRFSSMFRGGE